MCVLSAIYNKTLTYRKPAVKVKLSIKIYKVHCSMMHYIIVKSGIIDNTSLNIALLD